MKRLTQTRWGLLLPVCLAVLLVGCERPLNDPETVNPTTDPILPATLAVPTTDPNAQPTSAPAEATAVPEGETIDAGTDATADPGTNPTNTPETTEPRGEIAHTVVAGDTISGLSVLYNVPIDVIVAANSLASIHSLDIGQVLIIPAEGTEVTDVATPVPPTTEERTHVVQAGENLFRIGLQYGFTVNELATYNSIANPNVLDVGQIIKIPPNDQ